MIYRYMFFGYYKEKNIKVSEDVYYTKTAYFRDMVYIYIETRSEVSPYELVSGDFIPFPDGTTLKMMTNIFQYSPSDDEEEWERPAGNTPEFRVAYLKRDLIPKYVFYHYKMVHESCKATCRYGIIFLFDNMLVMYIENPFCEGKRNPRTLPENNLPSYQGDMILECGIPWDDYDRIWRVLDEIGEN